FVCLFGLFCFLLPAVEFFIHILPLFFLLVEYIRHQREHYAPIMDIIDRWVFASANREKVERSHYSTNRIFGQNHQRVWSWLSLFLYVRNKQPGRINKDFRKVHK